MLELVLIVCFPEKKSYAENIILNVLTSNKLFLEEQMISGFMTLIFIETNTV